jgi:hypothetical protein
VGAGGEARSSIATGKCVCAVKKISHGLCLRERRDRGEEKGRRRRARRRRVY